MWWLTAWAWVKKYWEWLLGVGLVVLGFFFGLEVKKRPVVISGDNPEKKKAEEDTLREIQLADARHEKALQELQERHDEEAAGVVVKITGDATRLENDPEATNEYLHEVGKNVRGPK